MDLEQREKTEESYKDLNILELINAEINISNHLDTYFNEGDYESFWGFLEESLIITNVTKEKPFIERETLMTGLKLACEYHRLNKNLEKADFFSYMIAYLQKLSY